jgi:hypothetical protein
MIAKLPHWVLVEKFPAFNDFESLTAIEQTARVYGKINELIENYNTYINEINKAIEEYEIDKDEEVNSFICRISCLTDNYINTIDMRIAHQDRAIAEVYDKFSTDVINNLKLLIAELKDNGVLDTVIYEALENIDGKIDSLYADYEHFKSSMTTLYSQNIEKLQANYNEAVENFNLQYNSNVAELEEDYQNTKSTLNDDYENTKSQLNEDYEQTKSQLNEDYEQTKTELNTEFGLKEQALEEDYNNAKTELENIVSDFTDCDYIVEQGSTDGWTYRKWNSGIMECWGRFTSTNPSDYASDTCAIYKSVPHTFTEHPVCICTAFQLQTYSSHLLLSICDEPYDGSGYIASAYVKCINPVGADYPCWFNFHLIGNWK